jgi:hypothetical protein
MEHCHLNPLEFSLYVNVSVIGKQYVTHSSTSWTVLTCVILRQLWAAICKRKLVWFAVSFLNVFIASALHLFWQIVILSTCKVDVNPSYLLALPGVLKLVSCCENSKLWWMAQPWAHQFDPKTAILSSTFHSKNWLATNILKDTVQFAPILLPDCHEVHRSLKLENSCQPEWCPGQSYKYTNKKLITFYEYLWRCGYWLPV